MRYAKILTSAGLAAALTVVVPPSAFAQRGARGHAVARGSARVAGGPVYGAPVYRAPVYRAAPIYRGAGPYYYRSYWPAINFSFFYGRPGFYGSYVYGSPYYSSFYGYGSPFHYPVPGFSGYPVPGFSGVPYGYGYSGYSGRPYGGIRIDLPQRDAEVFVDGYFTGSVDDFDGTLQQANLEAGPHQIEIRQQGFETISFDVNVEPGRTITYRASMRPQQP